MLDASGEVVLHALVWLSDHRIGTLRTVLKHRLLSGPLNSSLPGESKLESSLSADIVHLPIGLAEHVESSCLRSGSNVELVALSSRELSILLHLGDGSVVRITLTSVDDVLTFGQTLREDALRNVLGIVIHFFMVLLLIHIWVVFLPSHVFIVMESV